MLNITRRMFSSLSSLIIPKPTGKLAMRVLNADQAGADLIPITVKFVTQEDLTVLRASTTNTNAFISMQLDYMKKAPRSTCSICIPDASLWNDNFGSIYRNRMLLVNMGEQSKITNSLFCKCVNTAATTIQALEQKDIIMEIPAIPSMESADIIKSMANICVCSNHLVHNGKYFTKDEKKKKLINSIEFVPSYPCEQTELEQLEKAMNYGALLGESTVSARAWANEQPSEMNPRALELLCREICEKDNIEISVLQAPDLHKEGLNLIEAVGQGSSYPPRLIVMTYIGDNTKPMFTGLVGKAVTFDSGGLNLKPTGHIEDMQLDMGGGAAVLGALHALAKMNAPVNLVVAIPAVENMINSTSYKPGAIVKSYDGKYVEVCNTDAEGRLILADAMSYLQKKYELCNMVDLATLTGAVCVALGEYSAGLFSNNDEMANMLLAAGNRSLEKCWRLPIDEGHEEEITNCRVADIRSMGKGRDGGASTAAAFLKQFILDDLPWAHLDIAATGMLSAPRDWLPQGGTGYGVQLLIDWLLNYYSSSCVC